MINWPGKIYVALLKPLPISSTVRRFQAICKIMVCNYTETKMRWRVIRRVSNTCSPGSEAAERCFAGRVRDSRDGPRAHARAATGAVSWRQSSIVRRCASGGGARTADSTCGAMTARRFYEPFFVRAEVFFFGRTNGLLLSTLPRATLQKRTGHATAVKTDA